MSDTGTDVSAWDPLLLRESVGYQCSNGLSNCSSAWVLVNKENKIHERDLNNRGE